jgi:hypothetical protein
MHYKHYPSQRNCLVSNVTNDARYAEREHEHCQDSLAGDNAKKEGQEVACRQVAGSQPRTLAANFYAGKTT